LESNGEIAAALMAEELTHENASGFNRQRWKPE
jgi:hypothetical protein